MTSPLVKICGISDTETLAHAVDAGADFIGFVHFEKSPRHVGHETLATLIHAAAAQVKTVVVLVNPTDALLNNITANAKPDYVQLHGQESPERALEIKTKYRVKIIKAIAVSGAEDISNAKAFDDVADIILFDAKPARDAKNAGGLGISFDWTLLQNEKGAAIFETPNWMLSGGLSAENIKQAISLTHAPMVDVSSHIETPIGSGKKDIEKIQEFISLVKT